ncbi:MAG: hypothetical protein NVSMB64_17080 [Candidatus Velthaea sp.]
MDDTNIDVPGAVPVEEVLGTDPVFRLLGSRLANPWVLGVVLAALAIVVMLLGPASDSRFIYTDF